MKKGNFLAVIIVSSALALPGLAFAEGEEGGIGEAAQGNETSQSGKKVGIGAKRHGRNVRRGQQLDKSIDRAEQKGKLDTNVGDTKQFLGSKATNGGKANRRMLREGGKQKRQGQTQVRRAQKNRQVVKEGREKMRQDVDKRANKRPAKRRPAKSKPVESESQESEGSESGR